MSGSRTVLPAFSWDEAIRIRTGKISACLIPGSGMPPRIDSLRTLRRVVRVLDEDGEPTGQTRVERTATSLTIQSVSARTDVGLVGLEDARKCGFRTPDELAQAWLGKHPRTLIVRVVGFQCGDVRDRQPLLRFGAGHTLNRAMSPDPDAPLVPEEFQARLVEAAHMRDARRMAKQRQTGSVRSLAIRLKDAEKREDPDELARIRADLEDVENEMRRAA